MQSLPNGEEAQLQRSTNLPAKKRDGVLIASMILFMVFAITQHSFIRVYCSMEKILQVNLFSNVGYITGILVLSLLLPMGDLRCGRRPRISGLSGYTRFITGLVFFLPNIIALFLGPEAWLRSSLISAFMAVGNGAIVVLILGCFFTLMRRNRIFWAALANNTGTFISTLALGPGREMLQRYLFITARIAMTLSGVMLLLYLFGISKEGLLRQNTASADTEEEEQNSPGYQSRPLTSLSFLFPIMAAFIIFWTNSFTNQIFLPKLYSFYAPGFNVSTVSLLLALLVLGFLADRRWRRFLDYFVNVCSFLFLLAPTLLLFSNSHMLFILLYTLSIIMIQMIFVVFPFLIVDMFWQEAPSPGDTRLHKHSYARGFLAWLLPVSILMINTNAVFLMGPFRSFSPDNAYAVVLLTLAAVGFFLLSRKTVSNLPGAKTLSLAAIPQDQGKWSEGSRAESFRAHGLTEREIMAAELILQGLENDEIKEKMHVSISTVKMHVGAIFKKYKLKRRTEFIAMFVKE